MSDLNPQQVARRATGYFQPCFPASRPVSRPVFPSKVEMTGDGEGSGEPSRDEDDFEKQMCLANEADKTTVRESQRLTI